MDSKQREEVWFLIVLRRVYEDSMAEIGSK